MVRILKWIVWGIFAWCLAGLTPPSARAGVTGKVRGQVRDAQTGDPLPGVNVVITQVWVNGRPRDYRSAGLGAATDANGEYVILRVPPGVYSISASMMGYTTVTRRRVEVSVDRTAIANFRLAPTVLELGKTVTVEAARDVIRTDVSATESYVTDQDYRETPFANRVEDVLALQSGISGNLVQGEIRIRGGDPREVEFLVDGMKLIDRRHSRPVLAVQAGIVQEIKIMRNGFNAEYGQSRSGVINVVTKNPSDQFHFSVDYQFTPPQRQHYGRNKYDPRYNLWRLYAGPRAMEGDTLVIPDGLYDRTRIWEGWKKYAERLLSDSNPNNDLTAEEAYELWKWRHRPVPYGNRSGHNLDVSLTGRVPLLPWKANFLLGGSYEDHPFAFPQSRDHYDGRTFSLKVINILNPDTRLVLNGLYSEVRSVTANAPWGQWHDSDDLDYGGWQFPGYYPFSKPYLNRYASVFGAKLVRTVSSKLFFESQLSHSYVKWAMGPPDSARAEDGRFFHGRLYYDPQSGWIPKEKGADDNVSGYRMYGGAMTWDHSWNRHISWNTSLTYQFHPAHEFKAGFELAYDVIREDRVHWHNEDSSQAYIRRYRVEPIELGLFLQDKIEFEGMIANVGVRVDYFDPHGRRPDYRRALEYRSNRDIWEAYVKGEYPTFRPKPKVYVSPRIGISHPLSDRSKIYFNYGHFVQTPPSFQLYVTNVDYVKPSILQMGNADLGFEKMIAYEIGLDADIGRMLQFHIGAYYKDYWDLCKENSITYAHSDQSLIMDSYANIDYAQVRGLEIELRRTFGRFVTGWINYNYVKRTESNLTVPGLGLNPIITDDPNVGRNGVIWGVPIADVVRMRPYGRGVVTFSSPPDWGPRFKKWRLLANTRLSLQIFYDAGARLQHPRKSFRDAHPNVWFKELDRYRANVRLARLLRLRKLDVELYVDVSNVFHTKYRYLPGGQSREDYFDDLWKSGRVDQVGTDRLTNPRILRTENDDVYWARVKMVVFGARVNL